MTDSRPVVTRFAPSPTGYLHIGGARTALFNWLFARGRNGKFLLRIEDTDRTRSTPEATEAILQGLRWLGLDWDGEPVSQFAGRERHAEVAHAMLENGTAYKCFSTTEEIEAFREQAKAEGRSTLFLSPWRDADPAGLPDAPYAIRLKAPRDGETVVRDAVQGDVTFGNAQLDDMVLLRSDGTPTYMLAVVVDDHDMGVTHVIRGDDHLTNAARQIQIYQAMGWDIPVFAHIPLIHGTDGKKLSKRHGAVGLHEYAAMGYPAAAMRNYLARLGWSHGDDELFDDAQAKAWFDLDGIGKAPARLDFKKLEHVSGWHIARMDDVELLDEIADFRAATGAEPLSERQVARLRPALGALKTKAKTLPALLEQAHFALIDRPVQIEEKAAAALDIVSRSILKELTAAVQNASWGRDELEAAAKQIGESHGLGLGKVAAPLRAALAGRSSTPSVFDMMLALGRDETLARMQDQAG
ncbi:glutamate--tRNA ligase [Paracoccus denitrificans]|jgi:glutamyl-tRNA synthetase|uniref:Glutamate--tRNA ligase 2 n=1 Tax=Paracoccus denitrificans (strain Pd 1222) TaxID=318586 RepID=SYE2_PARDP|nr:glutamate--tRNA ligase [Paracoccus denitrificans]A1B8E0.1 RecName: Full=Glutamate--tRNA ligase 2; AltName: Full=Glutamyl-tRNA synthetase 2; Short=GluRS 2 [Paracoccus denitrificans PD1222]ABL71784.1 glutamyl-tRNA synthetase [Paracoccus denitrificans PD1222]MBB4628119.1 glutamyl-tRNA synthetase [Paracoccus denitrificans]MCU7429184.1 glutamate--tRNA ligase [Paracoccus denitrificans]QAR28373.1 glutamate--tRNA ligase [Paracoccus denitrificans]UPV98113.1 glutamate--tRNA ligase [Paracoccus denitr